MKKVQNLRGFTLIELLVVIAIIAILAAILFPVFAAARENARKASCISNMKQLATAMRMYSDDNGDRFAPGTTGAWEDKNLWWFKVDPYIKQMQGTSLTGVYVCPSSPKLRGGNENVRRCYGYNAYYLGAAPGQPLVTAKTAEAQSPSTTILFLESWRFDDGAFTATTPRGIGSAFCYPPVKAASICRPDYVWPPGWHRGLSNVAMVDGHVRSVKVSPPRETPTSPTPAAEFTGIMEKGGSGTPYDPDPWFRLDGRKP